MTNEAQKQYATGIMEGNALEDDLPENRLLSLRDKQDELYVLASTYASNY